MAKSSLERQIERQMKQSKQLANKKRREQDKAERRAVLRDRAATIINGQPIIEGFRVMDQTAEAILECLLNCEKGNGTHICFENDIFPDYVQTSLGLEFEKLIQYGMIGGLLFYGNGGMLDLLPPAFSYFESKNAAYEKQKEQEEANKLKNIINYGNLVFGDVSGSTLTVDNSIHKIEQAIEENGGTDKEDLYEILNDVKELIENIQTSRTIPKQKKLFERISDHMEKHGWFYGAVVQLLGTAAINLLGA